MLKIPQMRCDAGCGECCKLVVVTLSDFYRIKDYATEHGITPLKQGTTCPWHQNGVCVVYEVRPFICKLFGHVDDPAMTCHRGYNTNISRRKATGLLVKHKSANMLLHEILPEWKVEVRDYFPKSIETLTIGFGKHARTFRIR